MDNPLVRMRAVWKHVERGERVKKMASERMTYSPGPRGIEQPRRSKTDLDLATCWDCGVFFDTDDKYERRCSACRKPKAIERE